MTAQALALRSSLPAAGIIWMSRCPHMLLLSLLAL